MMQAQIAFILMQQYQNKHILQAVNLRQSVFGTCYHKAVMDIKTRRMRHRKSQIFIVQRLLPIDDWSSFLMKQLEAGLVFKTGKSSWKANDRIWIDGLFAEHA